MKRKWMLLVVLMLAVALIGVGLSGCEDTDVNINVNSNQETDQPTTVPTTQPEESTTGGGTIPEPPGPDSGIVERPTQPAQPTEPAEPTEPTKPTEGETPVEPPKVEEMTYKKYEALSEDEKMAFQNTFASRKEFLNWYKTAKKAYEDSQQHVTIGPGDGLNIGDYIK